MLLWIAKPRKLKKEDCEFFSEKIKGTALLDPAHAILESHKIFVNALRTLFKQKKLSAALTIERFAKKFPNEKTIWRLHGLRNRIAHETDVKVDYHEAEHGREEFIRALKSLV